MSLIKYIETGTEFFDTGEQTVTPLIPHLTTDVELTKHASEVSEYLKSLKADADNMYLHINAMGASDYWGMNANGDVFPEAQLLDSHKTFEEFGNFYKHHLNKPHIGHKKYGKVLFAHYNPDMHRVELIVEVWKKAAPDVVTDVADGKDVAVSMAIKVPYDECTIRGCGNVARTRGQYCDHGKSLLTRMLDDGQQVGRINPNGKFFDISKVFRPADRTGYVMRKVANAGYVIPSVELAEAYGIEDPWPVENAFVKSATIEDHEKLAQVSKLAEIEKKIEAMVDSSKSQDLNKSKQLVLASETAPRLSEEDILNIKKTASPLKALKSIFSMGGDVSFPEFLSLVIGDKPYHEDVAKAAPMVRGGFQVLSIRPELLQSSLKVMQDFKDTKPLSPLSCSCCEVAKKGAYPKTLEEAALTKVASTNISPTKGPSMSELLEAISESDQEGSTSEKLNQIVKDFGAPKEAIKMASDLGIMYYNLRLESPLIKAATKYSGEDFIDATGSIIRPVCAVGLNYISIPVGG